MEYRSRIAINDGWESILEPGSKWQYSQAQAAEGWTQVEIPHNWEDYQGYHRVSHGNLHGTAWYRRRISWDRAWAGKRIFLFFEGVGSYADVWVDGQYVGAHKGGRTCFTLDVTEVPGTGIRERESSLIMVRAGHPEKIDDLPWVCGGCYGTPNSEGSQPIGIFRPVHVVVTGEIRIKPFGVYITTPNFMEGYSDVRIESELRNYGKGMQEGLIRQELLDSGGKVIRVVEREFGLGGGEELCVVQTMERIENPSLWYPDAPALYRIRTVVQKQGEEPWDQVENSFGFRQITWENFDTGRDDVIDPGRLEEEPGPGNQYFVTYTRGSREAKVTIPPGGVRVSLPEFTGDRAVISIDTKIKNQDTCPHTVQLESFVQTYNRTKSIASLVERIFLLPGEEKTVVQVCEPLLFPDLWTRENPYLHNVMSTVRGIDEPLKEYCQTSTSFGIFEKDGIVNKGNAYVSGKEEGNGKRRRFLVNGRHYFINGTCEYEHMLGRDHAFGEEMIQSRVNMLQAAGFNALREAHCPHNLQYLELCEQRGILYWAQMGAHIFFDTEEFKRNFCALTEEWMRERRNSPAVFLWSIQNESMLSVEFTRQVTALIHRLDITCPVQRKAVTCNGGEGSDWNIPQNWSGTYGGSVETYGKDAVKMRLIGEYGQYRVKGKHEEGDMEEKQNAGGDVSEELFAYCLETKVREAEKVREYFYGHFQWLLVSHANPGRETLYCLDGQGSNGVGVVNSKGLFTSWGEPTDAYYMYRANYTNPAETAVLYLVSHSWPYRFTHPARGNIMAYTNCEEVELYDGNGVLLGRKSRGAKGEHILFREVWVETDTLLARGYWHGKCVTEDRLFFPALGAKERNRLESSAFLAESREDDLFRVNCGGKACMDSRGRLWKGDQGYTAGEWGAFTWGMNYEEVEDEIGSVGRIWDKMDQVAEPGELFTQFRYGLEKLGYLFPVPEGTYCVEMYFIEPWYGFAGEDAAGWRLFDVAVNGHIYLERLDIWKEAGGPGKPLCRRIITRDRNGMLSISFPHVWSGQAVISAIRIARAEG